MPTREDALAPLLSRPDSSGIFLDFDGTLSEIAPSPGAARAIERVSSVLAGLAGRFRLVAVVSGRSASEAATLIGAPPRVRVFGLYGLEEVGAATPPVVGSAATALPEIERAAGLVQGATVEPKGPHVAVHYRQAPDVGEAERMLLDLLEPVASAHGLRVLRGKRVVELGPSGGPTKGDVVTRLVREAGLRAAMYAGDDAADLDGFEALDRLASEGLATVKVAVRSPEVPSDLLEAATTVVEGPGGLVALLRGLVDL